jgi:hypothetical protein
MLSLGRLLTVVGLFASGSTEFAGGPGPANPAKPKFTIGKDTTFVTGPVDKDGYIDYHSALNDRLKQGVTADKNANVLLWQASGPRDGKSKVPVEYFQLLGCPAPPEKGEYFVDLLKYLETKFKDNVHKEPQEIADQIDRASQRPWTTKQYPRLASWLKANDKPLALVIQASKRSHYFAPILRGNSAGWMNSWVPGIHAYRDFANALATRAMLRVGEGHYEEAWQDLLACHRLGQVVARGGMLSEYVNCLIIDSMATEADLAFLDNAKLNVKDVMACLQDLQLLPAKPNMADSVDLEGRFGFLSSVMHVNNSGLFTLEAMSGGHATKFDRRLKPLWGKLPFDCDPALRNGNRFYDRLVALMRVKDRAARAKQWEKFEEDRKKLRADTEPLMFKALLEVGLSSEVRG